jgi:catechol 2,3-dioxygenase-like lactoylglutathione lyase family enzyme
MIVGIHHTALSTRDADRLVRFYRELFGFEVEFDFPWDESNEAFKQSHAVRESAGRVVMISNGSSRLEIFEYQKPAPRASRAPATPTLSRTSSIECAASSRSTRGFSAAGMVPVRPGDDDDQDGLRPRPRRQHHDRTSPRIAAARELRPQRSNKLGDASARAPNARRPARTARGARRARHVEAFELPAAQKAAIASAGLLRPVGKVPPRHERQRARGLARRDLADERA